MFEDPKNRERLCEVLRAYVEEWGAENVIILVPKHWRDYQDGYCGRVRLEFVTENEISIRVEYDSVRLNYDVHLRAA
jgi:hypothetical protein